MKGEGGGKREGRRAGGRERQGNREGREIEKYQQLKLTATATKTATTISVTGATKQPSAITITPSLTRWLNGLVNVCPFKTLKVEQ